MNDKLRQIQLCQLEMLKEVARICDKHNIGYWLAYGTMLGAVRHKGFIPWDDDLYIYMTMEGFKKFQKVCRKELLPEYFLQTPETESTMGWMYYKIRKNNTLMLEPHQSGKIEGFNYGVWIDIFPLISISDQEKNRRIQYSILRKLQYYRGCHPSISRNSSLKNQLKKLYSKSLWAYEQVLWQIVFILGGKHSAERLAVGNQFYSHISTASYGGNIYKRSFFESCKEYMFEGIQFKGIADYDEYLKKCYSDDYMIPRKYNAHVEDYSEVIV